ncbi:MAG: hypothetical protein MK101_09625 [Phycisphaerales bacterium]|nr:hypothetical protein [Phycisphaerales bacterium]
MLPPEPSVFEYVEGLGEAVVPFPHLSSVTRVWDEGEQVYFNLQQAIDEAEPGDRLELYGGPFQGPFFIEHKASLTIVGMDLGGTIIDGGGVHRGFQIFGSDDITLESLQLINCLAPECEFDEAGFATEPACGSGGALHGHFSNRLEIDSCVFMDNHSPSSGGAVRLIQCADSSIDQCVFRTNSARFGGALSIYDGADLHVTDSTFLHNEATIAGGAIELFHFVNGSVTVSESVFFANAAARGGHVSVSSSENHDLAADIALLMGGCHFIANRSAPFTRGGALHLSHGVSARILFSVLVQNRASEGPVAWVEGGSTLELAHSLLAGNRNREGDSDVYAQAGATVRMANIVTQCGGAIAPRIDGQWEDFGGHTVSEHCGYSADLTLDGSVDMLDLLAMLDVWGAQTLHRADIARAPDGPVDRVDAADLLALLAVWGATAPDPLEGINDL